MKTKEKLKSIYITESRLFGFRWNQVIAVQLPKKKFRISSSLLKLKKLIIFTLLTQLPVVLKE